VVVFAIVGYVLPFTSILSCIWADNKIIDIESDREKKAFRDNQHGSTPEICMLDCETDYITGRDWLVGSLMG
jgi:hypothetical protein